MCPGKDGKTLTDKREVPGSTPNFRHYPTDRDVLLKSSHRWINGKRTDDDVGPYWRVHDKLYDLTGFVDKHPGGRDWILASRGTDITELFEISHLTSLPLQYLRQYYVREASSPRNSPYTFHSNGFFKRFRERDSLAVSFLLLMVAAASWDSLPLALMAGVFLAATGNCAHNFTHQRDTWRLYYLDLTLLSSYEFRIIHIMSHHGYPNTYYDFEVAVLEPFWTFLPKPNKNWIQRYGSYILDPILLPLALFSEGLKRLWFLALGEVRFRPENGLPILELLVFLVLSQSIIVALRLWLVMHAVCSVLVVTLALVGTHHHPDIYHQGDAMRQDRDFGLCQLDAVRDRVEINTNLFLVAVGYGHHALHHLLPTVDHSKLTYLYPALLETCREHHIDYSFVRVWYMVKGKYLQLANITPSVTPKIINSWESEENER
ncbi:Cytochrome b5-related protein-like 1 [Homarus americanus]|uniref:Cytochrome b5-related protein-like 1 n=1 Tax=Homarus americanus TaxID=6706 RepID=A0A8J5NAP2_HOMAM|nr:Cytochrome b5-related protein-like 1 [Homarus americanus]